MTKPWTTDDLGDLTGVTTLVTGANTGIGLATATALARAGGTVILACRNLDKARAAQATIESHAPRGAVEIVRLDLADQAQIVDASTEVTERFGRIDRLINNAGVMAEQRQETSDGFELLFGTNHLGHFAFTGRILPSLLAADDARIVTVTSMSQRFGRIDWDDLHSADKKYRQFSAYAQSKLSCLLFSFSLHTRFQRAGRNTMSVAAHPGFAATDILHHGRDDLFHRVQRRLGEKVIQTPEEAARAQLRAAFDPTATGGTLYGPSKRLQTSGDPIIVDARARARDVETQERLWDLSVELTGVEFPIE